MDEKTKMLLDAQEHPEQFTDEALRQMQDDPEIRALMEATAQGKRALMKHQSVASQEAIDAAWQDFEAKHFPKAAKVSILHKVAASVIGLLFISGIAFAAIHIVRNYRNAVGEDVKSPTQETQISDSHQQALPTDTTATVPPVVFDNVTLDSILPQIARHYGYTVSFRSDKSKPLRLFLTWNPQDSIQKVTDKLNLFEQIHIVLDEQTMIVE
jgi:hypothetical protein